MTSVLSGDEWAVVLTNLPVEEVVGLRVVCRGWRQVVDVYVTQLQVLWMERASVEGLRRLCAPPQPPQPPQPPPPQQPPSHQQRHLPPLAPIQRALLANSVHADFRLNWLYADRFVGLTRLCLVNLAHLSSLTPLDALDSLDTLRIQHCPRVTDLSPIKHCSRLTKVVLECLPALRRLSPLASLPLLRAAVVKGCGVRNTRPVLSRAECSLCTALEMVCLEGCAEARCDLADLPPSLRFVNLSGTQFGWTNNNDDDNGGGGSGGGGGGSEACALQALDVSHTLISSLASLASPRLASVSWVSARGCQSLLTLSHLADAASAGAVSSLDLGGCSLVEDLAPLSSLVNLQHLSLDGLCLVSDLGPLSRLCALRVLSVAECGGVCDVGALGGLWRLERLTLRGTAVRSLDGLRQLPASSEPRAAIHSLQFLDLSACQQLTDLAPLCDAHRLEHLCLDGCVLVHDVCVLCSAAHMPLRTLRLARQSVGLAQAGALQSRFPRLRVHWV